MLWSCLHELGGILSTCTAIAGDVRAQELVEYRAKYFMGPGHAPPPILALGLSSRKNLCVHPAVAGAPQPAAWSTHCCLSKASY